MTEHACIRVPSSLPSSDGDTKIESLPVVGRRVVVTTDVADGSERLPSPPPRAAAARGESSTPELPPATLPDRDVLPISCDDALPEP